MQMGLRNVCYHGIRNNLASEQQWCKDGDLAQMDDGSNKIRHRKQAGNRDPDWELSVQLIYKAGSAGRKQGPGRDGRLESYGFVSDEKMLAKADLGLGQLRRNKRMLVRYRKRNTGETSSFTLVVIFFFHFASFLIQLLLLPSKKTYLCSTLSGRRVIAMCFLCWDKHFSANS